MSYSSKRRTEFEIEQQIFLGGQIAGKYKEFQDICMLSPNYAESYMFMKLIPELEETEDPYECMMKILKLMGQIDATRYWTELTKLSAILGDTRKRTSAKGLKDELTRAASESP